MWNFERKYLKKYFSRNFQEIFFHKILIDIYYDTSISWDVINGCEIKLLLIILYELHVTIYFIIICFWYSRLTFLALHFCDGRNGKATAAAFFPRPTRACRRRCCMCCDMPQFLLVIQPWTRSAPFVHRIQRRPQKGCFSRDVQRTHNMHIHARV